MPKQPTIDLLLNRFRSELQTILYPFFILTVIHRTGAASRQEIRDEIFRLTDGTVEFAEASHRRLVGRMEKTFRLIEPIEKQKDPTQTRYGLTDKGERLYAKTLTQVMDPLGDILGAD